MEWVELLKKLAQPDTWLELRETLSFMGPFYGALLTMVESFIPPLPLVLFVAANVFTFGLFWGFLFSWAGACLGSTIVYLIFLKFGQNKFTRLEERHPFLLDVKEWVHQKGIKVIFVLLCFPFTPSFLVNIFAAAVRLKPAEFLPVLIGGRCVMILSVSVLSANIFESLDSPLRLLMISIAALALYLLARIIYRKIFKR